MASCLFSSVNTTIQPGVAGKFAEGALDLFVSALDEDIK